MRISTRLPLLFGCSILTGLAIPGCSGEEALDTRPTAELSKPYPPDPKARDNFGKMTKQVGETKQTQK